MRESTLDLDVLAQSESVFALSNGHIGLRGNLDEGEPTACPGTYLNGFYESVPLPYAEAGYGYPGVRPDGRQRHQRQADPAARRGRAVRPALRPPRAARARARPARRHAHARGRSGPRPPASGVKITSTRLVSFAQRAIAAIDYRVEPLDKPLRVVVQSELVANEPLPAATATRAPPRPRRALESEFHSTHDLRAVLVHRTKASELRMAAGYDHVVESAADLQYGLAGRARLRAHDVLGADRAGPAAAAGQVRRLRLVVAALDAGASRPGGGGAGRGGPHRLGRPRSPSQREYLDAFWGRADVEIEGEARLQQALRFGMFHVLQAGARNEGRAIPAKGLTGSGYDGHAFWDTETFVLPMLIYSVPDAARDALTLAPLDARQGEGARRAARPRAAPRSPGGRSPARSARATGRPAPPPSTSTPTSPTPSRATGRSTGGRGLRTGATASSCSSRRRACGARSAITTPTAPSASTASPGPTSTPRSPTTTSTPTSARRRT